jgi:hypothetical protein
MFDDAVSSGQVISTKGFTLAGHNHVAIQFIYTAGSTGTCNMEVSNDNKSWVEVSGSILTLGSGNDIINKANLGSQYVRSSCTITSPIASMKIYIGGK